MPGKRPSADDDYWEEDRVFFGFGSVHDLRDHEGSTPRLHGMRSVSRAAAWALHDEPRTRGRKIGFKIPKAR
jgi:hypothetical protein